MPVLLPECRARPHAGEAGYAGGVDLTSYVEGWRQRIAEEDAARSVRESRLRALAQAAVAPLLASGARRVVLFGSVAEGTTTEASDIDLAVEGLPAEKLEEARARVAQVLQGRSAFDLVRVEDVGQAVRQAITCGEVLG